MGFEKHSITPNSNYQNVIKTIEKPQYILKPVILSLVEGYNYGAFAVTMWATAARDIMVINAASTYSFLTFTLERPTIVPQSFIAYLNAAAGVSNSTITWIVKDISYPAANTVHCIIDFLNHRKMWAISQNVPAQISSQSKLIDWMELAPGQYYCLSGLNNVTQKPHHMFFLGMERH